MRPIQLRNESIIKTLGSISDVIYQDDLLNELVSESKEDRSELIDKAIHPASDEYFHCAKNDFSIETFAFPRDALMSSINASKTASESIKRYKRKLQRVLGGRNSALTALYPSDGYIGWHHNGNAPGYNILFSYSLDGDGCFKYYDYETKEIKVVQDQVGWNVKVGYYPSENIEPENVYWHAAETKNPRLSVAFIVDDRNIWKSMINDITNGEYDREHIEAQGPKKKK
jgi:hypothetical protein